VPQDTQALIDFWFAATAVWLVGGTGVGVGAGTGVATGSETGCGLATATAAGVAAPALVAVAVAVTLAVAAVAAVAVAVAADIVFTTAATVLVGVAVGSVLLDALAAPERSTVPETVPVATLLDAVVVLAVADAPFELPSEDPHAASGSESTIEMTSR
jgi:hypothetical protein